MRIQPDARVLVDPPFCLTSQLSALIYSALEILHVSCTSASLPVKMLLTYVRKCLDRCVTSC